MLSPSWFNDILKQDHPLKLINGVWVDNTVAQQYKEWSFSQEWQEHKEKNAEHTWVWNVDERLQQFFIETRSSREEIQNKTILDAGCGNGELTTAISNCGANVAGIDIHAHLPASNDHLQFVRASFDNPPFINDSFDIVIANGSIHHTKNTLQSFRSLASLVKEGGKLYVWIYRKPETVKGKILLGIADFLRFFISRVPIPLQKMAVRFITSITMMISRIRKGENSKRSKEDILINNYDTFTPRYRSYHTTTELAKWFHDCGFEEPVLSHWDNKYGFGMMAVKNKNRRPAAGLNFGKNQ